MDYMATIGTSCREEETLAAMFAAGMTSIRLNLSHGSIQDSAPLIETYHRAAARAGVPPQLVVDIQGPELRVGPLAAPLPLADGSTVRLGTRGIPVPPPVFFALEAGSQILLDDGSILLEVMSPGETDATCRVLRGGVLHSRKSIALSGSPLRLPTLAQADLDNLSIAADYGVTGVMQPFCTKKEDLITLRIALRTFRLSRAKIYAKIENNEGVDALEELIAHADEILIARGDLGNAAPLWQLPATQKAISYTCNKFHKPFSVATQMLHSMQHAAVPTRAEVSDIYNAVMDGASTLVLTGETAAGKYPVEAMRYLVNTAETALRERYRGRN